MFLLRLNLEHTLRTEGFEPTTTLLSGDHANRSKDFGGKPACFPHQNDASEENVRI